MNSYKHLAEGSLSHGEKWWEGERGELEQKKNKAREQHPEYVGGGRRLWFVRKGIRIVFLIRLAALVLSSSPSLGALGGLSFSSEDALLFADRATMVPSKMIKSGCLSASHSSLFSFLLLLLLLPLFFVVPLAATVHFSFLCSS